MPRAYVKKIKNYIVSKKTQIMKDRTNCKAYWQMNILVKKITPVELSREFFKLKIGFWSEMIKLNKQQQNKNYKNKGIALPGINIYKYINIYIYIYIYIERERERERERCR